jgi:hypothetical protein
VLAASETFELLDQQIKDTDDDSCCYEDPDDAPKDYF